MILFIKDTKIEFVSGKKKRYGLYKCFCGNEFECLKTTINTNRKTHCGCKTKEINAKSSTKHGLYNSRLYKIRQNMIQRCTNSKVPNYSSYGGRGIIVCNEWKNDLLSFYNWALENGYQEDLSIDRIDPNGNYEPNNCQWVNKSIQSRNTRILRTDNKSGYRGVVWNKTNKKWQAHINLFGEGKYKTLGRFDTPEQASFAYQQVRKIEAEKVKSYLRSLNYLSEEIVQLIR